MKKIKVLCPAKINMTLKVGKKQPDGFHPIESIMQAVSLFDYITLEAKEGHGKISLSGTSTEIPYNEKNIAHKAAKKFLQASGMDMDINIYIEKNIPVCAGLAGGSTDAAGVIYALNKLCGNALLGHDVFRILKELGSDLNFCMTGSKQLCTGKGDIMKPLEFEEFPLTLVKPKNLAISAKEAYRRFDETNEKSNMPNDLEFALLPYYKELRYLHDLGFQMSGSGPTYFIKKPEINMELSGEYEIFENLKAVNHGILEVF